MSFNESFEKMNKWDVRFLQMAETIASWSKDPSTKCGSVIVRPDKTIVSLGYNGFPRGLQDKESLLNNREEKYQRVIHAEMNALLSARESVKGCTLYIWPFLTCDRCSVHIIQSGITRVVAPKTSDKERTKRWVKTHEAAANFYLETGVKLTLVPEGDKEVA